MKKIEVKASSKNYNIIIDQSIFEKINFYFKREKIDGDLLLVIDSKVNNLYSKVINDTFAKSKNRIKKVVLTSTEKNKNFEAIKRIHSALIKNNFGRDSIIVAIGGGIIGDVAGFAAATFMRGIKYVQVPTTLLSSVDSSVGGKTGINFDHTKNVIGSFYQPELVIIDSNFLQTLPNEEMLCGLGEIVKYAFLTNTSFYNYVNKNSDKILNNDKTTITKVIAESITYKGSVVEADEKESGVRKVLNLGHTFAHAFEVDQNHKLKHGQAVIVGITCALYLSKDLDLISENNFAKYLEFLISFNNSIQLKKVNISNVYNIMKRDKKNRANQIKFVLLNEVGKLLTDVPADKKVVIKSIEKGIAHF